MTGRRLALLLEYDGSPPLLGSQRQKNAPSVQGELEAAVHKFTGERLRVSLAGRTDAGVHALGQVAALTTTSKLKTDVFERGLNALLPYSIAVRNVVEVAEDFRPAPPRLSSDVSIPHLQSSGAFAALARARLARPPAARYGGDDEGHRCTRRRARLRGLQPARGREHYPLRP